MGSTLPSIVGDFDFVRIAVISYVSAEVGVDSTESGALPLDLTVDGLAT